MKREVSRKGVRRILDRNYAQSPFSPRRRIQYSVCARAGAISDIGEEQVEAVTYRIVKVVPYAAPVATLDKAIKQNVDKQGPKRHT
jgi:hypothetical protein